MDKVRYIYCSVICLFMTLLQLKFILNEIK